MKIKDLTNKVCCITGKFNIPRKDIVCKLELEGVVVLTSMSRCIDYLICGFKGGQKLEKAKEWNIPVIGVDELEDILGIRLKI